MSEKEATAAELLAAAGAIEVFSSTIRPVRWVPGKGTLDDLMAGTDAVGYGPNQTSYLSFHQMGSARMGSDPSTSVVDGENQAHDIAGGSCDGWVLLPHGVRGESHDLHRRHRPPWRHPVGGAGRLSSAAELDIELDAPRVSEDLDAKGRRIELIGLTDQSVPAGRWCVQGESAVIIGESGYVGQRHRRRGQRTHVPRSPGCHRRDGPVR